MSYLTEAFDYIVQSHNYHTNNAYLIISDEYQIDRINKDENCGYSKCSPANQPIGLPQYKGERISPTVSRNDFQQLPGIGCNSNFYHQRGRGPSDVIYTSDGVNKFCSQMNTCTNLYDKPIYTKCSK